MESIQQTIAAAAAVGAWLSITKGLRSQQVVEQSQLLVAEMLAALAWLVVLDQHTK